MVIDICALIGSNAYAISNNKSQYHFTPFLYKNVMTYAQQAQMNKTEKIVYVAIPPLAEPKTILPNLKKRPINIV